MTYKHLSQAERHKIHSLMKAGHDQSQSAKALRIMRQCATGVARMRRETKLNHKLQLVIQAWAPFGIQHRATQPHMHQLGPQLGWRLHRQDQRNNHDI